MIGSINNEFAFQSLAPRERAFRRVIVSKRLRRRAVSGNKLSIKFLRFLLHERENSVHSTQLNGLSGSGVSKTFISNLCFTNFRPLQRCSLLGNEQYSF